MKSNTYNKKNDASDLCTLMFLKKVLLLMLNRLCKEDTTCSTLKYKKWQKQGIQPNK